jgi:hypothetical protein
VCKLKELAEENNEENEGCIQRVTILTMISAAIYLKVTRVNNVPSRHKTERYLKLKICSKSKAIPLHRPGQALRVSGGRGSRFEDSRHMRKVRLSVLRTGRLYPQEIFLVFISVRG